VEPGHPLVGNNDDAGLRQQRPKEIRGCRKQSVAHEDVVRTWPEPDADWYI
jgi:hypothetical protein